MQIVLHIGAHKTGSSTLQWTLAKNRGFLLQHGICFPECDHGLLGGLCGKSLDRAPRLIKHKYAGNPSQALHDLEETWQTVSEAATARPRILILSSEYFFRRLDETTAPDLRQRLEDLDGNLRVVAYARQHSDRYVSAVQQVLRLSSRFPPRMLHNIKYEKFLDQWEHHFPGQVSVFPYERKQLVNGDVVSDFLSRIGSGVEPSQLVMEDRNPTLSAEAMSILQGFHRRLYPNADHQPRPGKSIFLKELSHLDAIDPARCRPRLRAGVAELIDGACADDAVALAEKWNVHFPASPKTTERSAHFETVEEICDLDTRRQRRLALATYGRWLLAFTYHLAGGPKRRIKRLLTR